MDEHGLLLTHRIKPEGAVYLSSDCSLRLSAYNVVSSLSVGFAGQYIGSDGEIHYFDRQFAPTTDRAETQLTVQIGQCVLLSLVAYLVSGNANRGQCYVRARVHRGAGTPLLYTHQLLGEYLTDDFFPAFPVNPIRGSLEGPGMLRSITGTDPAAGVEVSETVPTGARWRFVSADVTLVSDATVANRTVRFVFDDGTTVYFKCAYATAQTATQTLEYVLAAGGSDYGTRAAVQMTSASVGSYLLAGHRIRTVSNNLQAGDNYGAPQLNVEEWIEA